jgi:hemolysin III
LGLSILLISDPLAKVIAPSSLMLLAAGAALYLIGVVFHVWERLPNQNAVWHWLVLLAAALHYWAIAQQVSAATATPSR